MSMRVCKDSDEMQEFYPDQYPLRMKSGEYGNEDVLTAFIYLILRDHLTPGVVESVVLSLKALEEDEKFEYTNGWLAQYAAYIRERLTPVNDNKPGDPDSE